MKKKLLISLLALLSHSLFAQSYTLTRGLPVAEIAGSGTAITGLNYNSSVGPLNIGFNFSFFENTYSQFYLASNGHISFGNNNAGLVHSIPASTTPNNVIAFGSTYWSGTKGSPTINYFTTGTAPNRILVINFKNVSHNFSSSTSSLQIQLFESSGKIETHYTSFYSGYSWKATIGIENANGSIGITNRELNNIEGLSINNETIRFEKTNLCSDSVMVSTSSNILCHGSSTLTANTSSTGNYQWFKNSAAIAGATNSIYEARTPGVYSVRVLETGGCISQSNDVEIVDNINLTLTAAAYICSKISVGGIPAGNYSYQWLKDNEIISGQTSTSIMPQSVGNYKVEVSSGNCKVISSARSINANLITSNARTTTICNNTSLYVSTTSQPDSITYKWTGPNGFSSTEINPEISHATANNSGIYTVIVNFGCGDIQSTTTQVTINPNSVQLPQSISGTLCSSINQDISVSQTPSPVYTWVGPNGFSSSTRNLIINDIKNTHAGIYTLTVNFGCGDIQTATTNLIIKTNDLSIPSTFSSYVCNALNLYAQPSYTPNLTYSWAGPNGFSSTTSSPTISNMDSTKTGIYTVTVNFGCGDVKTATTNVTTTANSLSIYSSSPTNLCNTTYLSANTNSASSATYSWTGPNGFSSTLSNPAITNTSPTNEGIYTVTVNFGCGDIQTATTNVSVSPNTLSINASHIANICGNVTLNAFTSGSNSKTFTWAGPNGFTSNSSSPIISNATATNAGIYTITVDFGCGDIKTATTSLSVTANTISISPSVSANLCGTAFLSVSTSNTSPKTYLWAGPNGFSSTQEMPSINNITSAQAGIYTVTVNFGCGDSQSATTNLTVTPNTLSLSATRQAKLCNSVTLFNNSTSTSNMTYLWKGPNDFSSTQSEPILRNLTQAEGGVYTLTVNFGCGDTQTATTDLVLSPNTVTINPIITTNICGNTFVGTNADFTEARTFSWTGPNGFTSTLNYTSIQQVTVANAGIYSVTVNFGCGDVQTATTNLSVLPNTISIDSTHSINLCGTTNLRANTSYTALKTYLWTGPNGFISTQENPSINNATAANAGIYTLTVDFGCGAIQTATTKLTLKPNTLSIPSSFSVSNCKTVNLYTTSTHTNSRTYSWVGPNGFSSTSNNPAISDATEADEGTYTVTVNFGCGEIKTATTYVTVNPNTVNISSNYNATVCSSVTLSVTPDAPIKSYNWRGPSGFASTTTNATIYPVTSEKSGIYSVTVDFGCGDIQTNTTNLTVSPNNLYLSPNFNLNICGSASLYPQASDTPSRSFSWRGPNGFMSTNSSLYFGNATETNTGVYTLTVNFGCGDTQTATTNVSVRPNTLSISPTFSPNLCGTFSLFASTSHTPSSTYLWTGPNGFSSTSSQVSINNVTSTNAGIYTLTVNFGCNETLTATTEVIIASNRISLNPSVSSNLCGNLSLSASTTYTPNQQYLWTGPNNFSSTNRDLSINNITNANAGTYTLTVDFGCGETISATTLVSVTSNTLTVPPSFEAIHCGTANLYAYVSNTTNSIYSWKGPNGFVSNEINPIIRNAGIINGGIYTLTVNFGCGEVKTATTELIIRPIPLQISNSAEGANCPGKIVNLAVNWNQPNLTASYIWSGPNGFSSNAQQNSITLTNNSAGIYTVTANFGTCGISMATTEINMEPPIFKASSSSSLVLCESNSIELFTLLNNSSTANIAGTTTTYYTWQGPDNFSSNERNPKINDLTTAKAGFYTVTVDLANGCKGSYTSSVAINVSKNPELVTGYRVQSPCEGNSVMLYSGTNPLGNTSISYLWTGPNAYSSNQAGATINNIGTGGIYTLTATFTGGCTGTYTSVLPVFISTQPKVQLDTQMVACLNRPFMLLAFNVNNHINNTYKWTGPNNFTSTDLQPYFFSTTPELAGTYTLTVTDTSGACPEVFTVSTVVSVNENCYSCSLEASNTSTPNTCVGSDITLRAYLSYGYETVAYSWAGPNGFSSTSRTPKLTNVTSSGTYTVTATSTYCTGTFTATTFVNISSANIKPTLDFSVNENLCKDNYIRLAIKVNNGILVNYTISGPNGYTYYGISNYPFQAAYTFIQSPTQATNGTYTVNATFRKFCSDSLFHESASVNVLFNTRPLPPIITGSPTSIDIHDSSTLTATGCSGGNTLQWFNSSTSNSVIVRPTNTTSYWAVCNQEGCSSASAIPITITVNSCPQQFVLTNPSQNYNNGTIVRKAKANAGNITATNLVTGNAKVTYQAKTIMLNAGFKADAGTVFKAETGGCD